MTDSSGFAKLVPGFDFLQSLAKNAGAAIPGMGQWVAPTIDPAELEKRIEELRTVQFWLEQNARLLGTTIQALEVQRMTLSTLKTMNVQMEGLRDSLKVSMPVADAAGTAAKPGAPGAVDPMQWWNALTKQFTEIASTAIKDTEKAAEAVRKASDTTAAKPAAKSTAVKKPPSVKKAVRRKPYARD
jgi:hypothetical protein